MDKNTIQVAIYVIGAFIGGGSLASWYWSNQAEQDHEHAETTLAFTIRDKQDDCNERINQIKHDYLQEQINQNDEGSRRRDNRQEGTKIVTDEPLKFEEQTGDDN